MTGETDLRNLLRSMQPTLHPGVYAFATVQEGFDFGALRPRMMFEEAEGTTLILLRELAEAHGLAYEFPSRMITLNVHSSLDAVGFLAAITQELASLGMGVNPVSAFYHDHLFVPVERANEALTALEALAQR